MDQHVSTNLSSQLVLDRRGNRRTPATLPGAGKGRAPANKGVRLPPEELTAAEVRSIIGSWDRERLHDVRQRAMLTLVYRADLKTVDLLNLQRQDWDAASRVLTLPERPQMGRTKEGRRRIAVELDNVATTRLEEWLVTRRAMGALPSSPLFCGLTTDTVRHPMDSSTLRRTLRNRGLKLGIEKRLTFENLRHSGRIHRTESARHLQLIFAPYLDEERFGTRYPGAHALWVRAADLLRQDADRNATRIGHDCREALVEFADELVRHQLPSSSIPRPQTVTRVRSVLDARVHSGGVRAQLEALLAYWGTVSDLAQRQEHGANREAEVLSAADSRRLVFQTRLVMYEIDDACNPSPNRPR